MPEILLIRHAESQANLDGYWNGQLDGSLSAAGEASLVAIGKRLHDRHFDVVMSSPLERARRTAESFAADFETSDQLVELDIGGWEGKSRAQILAEDGDYLRQAVFGRQLPMGETGESLSDLERRALGVVDSLANSLDEHGRAAVVTHGGFIQEVLRRHLAGHDRRIHTFAGNTSITKLVWTWDSPRLAGFNDLAHFGPRPHTVQEHLDEGNTVMALIRHGQTRANTEQRWQGQGDWGLDELGHRQAQALRDWYGQASTVYASPLGRAQATAGYIASNGVVTVEGLKEIDMGLWEDLTSDEIYETWPDLMSTIYRDGVDLKRGETGESWGELTGRFRATVDGVPPASAEPTVVVAHGGAIRAYVSSFTSTTDSHSESLYTPANTSVTHVALTGSGPLLLDYSVSAHLESLS
ncbi:MAG TPA: histidine phosphatase family protein [Acidimicrobiia bacterium]|nr:histidine phosphatase family protein [Acidimicrobiia bacterium]